MNENEKALAAAAAVQHVQDNMIIGLGTGSTARYAIEAVGRLVKDGMRLRAVATSHATQVLAAQHDIEITDPNTVAAIDLTIDGADEFTEAVHLIKGGGGALFKEKIVASMSKEVIIIADSSKLVKRLGKFTVPVEAVPFAEKYVLRQIKNLGGTGSLRLKDNAPFITEQGNHIIDAGFGLIDDPASLAAALDKIEGILVHGLFIGLAGKVVMGVGGEVRVYSSAKSLQ